MNKSELIAKIAEKSELSKKDAEKALNAFVDSVTDALVAGDKVVLVGFGSFETKKRAARKGKNPQTGAEINIPATTAMETLHTNGRIIALQSGANVVMPNVTDLKYRQNYQIYPEKFFDKDKSDIEEKIKKIGRVISKTYGNSKSF